MAGAVSLCRLQRCDGLLRRAAAAIGAVMLVLFVVRGAHAQQLPYFEESDCTFGSSFLALGGDELRCGYVHVPERRLGAAIDGDDAGIRLAVVILPATGADPVDDPLFVAQGGPGGSTIDVFVDLLAVSPLRERRDIVLFDQRGTLYSEPNLICTEMQERMDELAAASDEEYPALLAAVTADCRARFVDAGIDLAAYNSLENAADVEDVRRALGYDAINFYGVSYGTLLGLHLMRDFPDHLRSVILDGVVPPQVNFITEVAASEERVFAAFFQACAEDEECRAMYGDLEARFFALVDELNTRPTTVTLLDPTSGERTLMTFTGDDLVDFFFQMFYWTGSPAILPKVMVEVEAGRMDYVGAMLSVFVFDDTFSDGMYNSVLCAEDADFVPAEAAKDTAGSYFSDGFQEELEEYIVTCDVWNVPALGTAVDEPVVSDVPTLLLSGGFDPITPPHFAEIGARTLSRQHLVELPGGGHGIAFGTDACVDQIVDDFLAAPGGAVDTACLPSRHFDFVAPDALVLTPLVYLNVFNSAALQRYGVAALFLAVALSALTVWPLGWFVRNLRGRTLDLTTQERRFRRRARLLVVAFDLLAMVFVTLVGLTLAFAVFSNDALMMLGALPGSMRWIFWLPWVLALLAAGIAFTAAYMWWRGDGRVGSRIYYLVLTGAVLGYVYLLVTDGILALAIP